MLEQVNSLNLELITALNAAIEDLEAKKAKGLILTSVSQQEIFFLGLPVNLLWFLVVKLGVQCRFGYFGDV